MSDEMRARDEYFNPAVPALRETGAGRGEAPIADVPEFIRYLVGGSRATIEERRQVWAWLDLRAASSGESGAPTEEDEEIATALADLADTLAGWLVVRKPARSPYMQGAHGVGVIQAALPVLRRAASRLTRSPRAAGEPTATGSGLTEEEISDIREAAQTLGAVAMRLECPPRAAVTHRDRGTRLAALASRLHASPRLSDVEALPVLREAASRLTRSPRAAGEPTGCTGGGYGGTSGPIKPACSRCGGSGVVMERCPGPTAPPPERAP